MYDTSEGFIRREENQMFLGRKVMFLEAPGLLCEHQGQLCCVIGRAATAAGFVS